MGIQALREQRNEKAREYRNTLDKHPKDAALPEEAKASLDTLLEVITNLDDRIDREQKAMDMAAEKVVNDAVEEVVKGSAPGSSNELFAKWLKGGDKALTAQDWETINNTMSTGTDSEGGYTVQTDVAVTVIDALKAFGGMRGVATVITTEQGNSMNWPTSDGTTEEGEIVAENASATDDDMSFGTKSLPVYKYSSKVVPVPIELLQDSSVNIEAFVNGRIVTRLGRITNKHFTIGTGSGQPLGLVAAAGEGKVGASGQDVTFIYDDLVDLEHSVDPAYRELGARWMFNDATLKVAKKIKDTQGRPLWMPDMVGGAPATLNGYEYTINQSIAVMAANAKSILFGHMASYVIRDVMNITFHRFTDSAYVKKGQVGFLAFMRSGGNFVDVGGGVKYYRNAAS
ncbi:MAG: phage major capsid protein [Pseudodesulfovibrio sp.]|nr:phage major capsid protein [Pseudodesulfovibrio sp.]